MFSFLLTAAALAAQVATAADVFAHFMVQNSYAYTVDQWKADMAVAKHTGIDGFALNWIPPDCQADLSWSVDRIADAFEAAEDMKFKLMHSFDMSYTECNIFWNQTFMADILTKHAGSSATYRWNSNILVSTYGGDQADEYGDEFFQGLKDLMKSGSNSISLAPALTTYSMQAQTDPNGASSDLIENYPSIDGYLNWQAWPLDMDKNITIGPDKALQSSLTKAGKTGPYIMSVSPWQYKDLNDGNPLNAWVAYSDYLFPDRFESITGPDAFQPDIIELLTWNDFAESHYIRDLPDKDDETATDYVVLGDHGNYVWGQDHSGWRRMVRYYINYWKSGKRPTINRDWVVYWYRIHPKDAVCAGGLSTPIRNADFPADAVFAWALLKDYATVSMSVGDNKYWDFDAKAGVPAVGMVPFPSDLSGGVTPEVSIMRGGKMVEINKGPQPINAECEWANFNPVVGIIKPS